MRYQGEDLIELIRVLFTAVEYLANRSIYFRISEKSVCAVNILFIGKCLNILALIFELGFHINLPSGDFLLKGFTTKMIK